LGIQCGKATHASSVRISRQAHPITRFYDADRRYPLRQPVELAGVETGPGAEVLLNAEENRPAMFALRLGKGKIVQSAVACDFWLPEHFGHAQGLDGLFWRSIAWAA